MPIDESNSFVTPEFAVARAFVLDGHHRDLVAVKRDELPRVAHVGGRGPLAVDVVFDIAHDFDPNAVDGERPVVRINSFFDRFRGRYRLDHTALEPLFDPVGTRFVGHEVDVARFDGNSSKREIRARGDGPRETGETVT